MSPIDGTGFEVVPPLGLGTWQNTDPAQCRETVRTALEMGYRHVDTAQLYGNETAVGEGVAAADVDREEVFLATKVWFDSLAPEVLVDAVELSLKRLDTGYLDLLYVHWPAGTYDPGATLGTLADLRDDGVVRHVGVSNFTPELLAEAVDVCDAPVVANQVEMHPYLQQEDLRERCVDRGVQPVAYSPLVHGEALDDDELAAVAEKHDASVAQVVLAWLRERGVAAVPKATGEAHLRDNLASLDLELDDADRERIAALDRDHRFSDPSFAPDW